MATIAHAKPEKASGKVNYHTRTSTAEILIDAGGIAGNRVDPELNPVVVDLEDVRDANIDLQFTRDGLTFVRAPSKIESFRDLDAVKEAYDAELGELLAVETGGSEIVVFDHTLRIDDQGKRPPARHVHGDYNADSAQQRLVDILGEARAAAWAAGHFAIINVWRPIENVVEQAPLTFAHPATVAVDDWIDIDIVYPDRRGQITGLVWRPTHRWLYLSRMRPDEAAIFRVYDNGGRAAVAHSAAELLDDAGKSSPRQSIESRTLVRFK